MINKKVYLISAIFSILLSVKDRWFFFGWDLKFFQGRENSHYVFQIEIYFQNLDYSTPQSLLP